VHAADLRVARSADGGAGVAVPVGVPVVDVYLEFLSGRYRPQAHKGSGRAHNGVPGKPATGFTPSVPAAAHGATAAYSRRADNRKPSVTAADIYALACMALPAATVVNSVLRLVSKARLSPNRS
jgi:hypothetical protein